MAIDVRLYGPLLVTLRCFGSLMVVAVRSHGSRVVTVSTVLQVRIGIR